MACLTAVSVEASLETMGKYKALFDDTRSRLQNGDAKNPVVVSVSSQWTGDFRSKISIRDFEISIDQPKGFGGSDTGPKPSEMALADLAACQAVTCRLYADASLFH